MAGRICCCLVPLVAAGLLRAAPAPLAIVNVALHQYEDGPAVPASFAFVTGEAVFVSFFVSGYQSEGEDKAVRLEYRLQALDAAGVPIVESKTGKLQVELADQDKDWKPKLRWDFMLPPLMSSGSGRVAIAVKDLVGGQEATKDVPFSIRGYEVEPSDALAVRNFRFLRGEEDTQPLAAAAYRPGDSVWARFDITGFNLAEKNRPHVEYDISVLAPGGRTLYTQQNAAVDQEASFYPKRYVPGVVSLNLQATIKPGEYTIVVAVRDQVGKQATESRHKFQIE